MGTSGTSGGFQCTARYIWSSEISNSQGIWSSRKATICTYLVGSFYLALTTNTLLLFFKQIKSRKYFFSFNQLDLPEYTSKTQLEERLLLAIHEASEGFGFG